MATDIRASSQISLSGRLGLKSKTLNREAMKMIQPPSLALARNPGQEPAGRKNSPTSKPANLPPLSKEWKSQMRDSQRHTNGLKTQPSRRMLPPLGWRLKSLKQRSRKAMSFMHAGRS